MNAFELMIYFLSGALIAVLLISFYNTSKEVLGNEAVHELANVLLINEELAEGANATYNVSSSGKLVITQDKITLVMNHAASMPNKAGLLETNCEFNKALIIEKGAIKCA